jgi:16S rRNA (adenine1518-N6/adenine1519-N6)-dimethyltransferase
MEFVRPKKYLGQHFLKDESIALHTVKSLRPGGRYSKVLEVGPGMGVLTKYLLEEKEFETWAIEIDRESIAFLENKFPDIRERILAADFLEADLEKLFTGPFAVIGNFPYNISSQILFKVLYHRNLVPEVVGMFQKEVAERIASVPGKKSYGIISILLQAWYSIEYLFTVEPNVFIPPPKVRSAVIRLTRNDVHSLGCDETLFIKVVKAGFNQRRKTLRNSLKQFRFKSGFESNRFLTQRAEELSVSEFAELTNMVEPVGKL